MTADNTTPNQPQGAMDWLMDYHDCLMGEHGHWWERRAEQHQVEINAGEIPGKWWTWRDVRQKETEPPVEVQR